VVALNCSMMYCADDATCSYGQPATNTRTHQGHHSKQSKRRRTRSS
jgi:hypothetical protein